MDLFYYLIHPFQLGEAYPYLQRTGLEWSNPAGAGKSPIRWRGYLLYSVLLLGIGFFAGKKGDKLEDRELRYAAISEAIEFWQ